MFDVLPADERGTTRTDWLHSRHSFSFGRYRNPERMGFRTLRVINDDIVDAGAGFGEHSHRDMEIISYVVEGGLKHRDSTGNSSVIRPGDVQIMSAGTGIRHSEFNPSDQEPCRFLQIWIPPSEQGLEPRHDERSFALADQTGRLHLLVDPDGEGDALKIYQDARLYAGRFDGDDSAVLELDDGRHGWVQVVRGDISVNGNRLSQGDGAAVSDVSRLEISDGDGAELLVFDLG